MNRTTLTCLLIGWALAACVDTAGGGGGDGDDPDMQPRDARAWPDAEPSGDMAVGDAASGDMAAEPDLSPTLDMTLEADMAFGADMAPAPDMAPDAGPPPCQPRPERCDGLDDDCDGRVDEDFAGLGQACALGVGLCRAAGVTACTADGAATACDAVVGEPIAEACNGADDDCDGATDEALGVGEACAAGVGACEAVGRRICGPDGAAICDAVPDMPGEEACNGVDDDCDGAIDEALDGVDPCAATCGNGVLEGDEACDDGNRIDGDGCPADCRFADTGGCLDGALNVVQNPGFETGALPPWVSNGQPLVVDFAHSGTWAAQTTGNVHVEQRFDPPVPVATLLSARFWAHHPPEDAPAMSIEWTYADGTNGRGRGQNLGGWTQQDILADLNADRSLASIRIWGYAGGGPAPDIVHYDDFEFCVPPR